MAQVVSDGDVYALSRGILGREPDLGGFNYLTMARDGASKEEIMAAMGTEVAEKGRVYDYDFDPKFGMDPKMSAQANYWANIATTTGLVPASDPFAFDVQWYKANNPDLQNMSDEQAKRHYETFGRNEGRPANQIEADALAEAKAKFGPYYDRLLSDYVAQQDVYKQQAEQDYIRDYGAGGRQTELLNRILSGNTLEAEQAKEDLAALLGNLGANRQQYLQEWEIAQPKAQEAIGAQAADSGLFSSGGRIQSQQEQAAQAERDRAAYERGYQYQMTGAQRQTDRTVAEQNKQNTYAQSDYMYQQQQAQLAKQRYLEQQKREREAKERELARQRAESEASYVYGPSGTYNDRSQGYY